MRGYADVTSDRVKQVRALATAAGEETQSWVSGV